MEQQEPKISAPRPKQSAFKSVTPLIRTQKGQKSENKTRAASARAIVDKEIHLGRSFTFTVGSLIVVAALMLIFVVNPVFNYLDQRDDYNKSISQLKLEKEKNETLKADVELWKTQSYLEEQARERLGYSKPNETRYTVIDPDNSVGSKVKDNLPAPPPKPWFFELAHNVWQVGNVNDKSEVPTKGDPSQVDPGAKQKPEDQKHFSH